MKTILCALIGMLLPIVALSEEIELAGIFFLGNKGSFSLNEVGSGKNSGWIGIGESFEGYRLESYSRTDKILRLTSSDHELLVSLRSSPVRARRIELRGHLSYEREDPEPQEDPPELQAARARLSVLLERYRERHPVILEQQERIRQLERQHQSP